VDAVAGGRDARLILGIMSGTSADAVDLALLEISGQGGDRKVSSRGGAMLPLPDAVTQGIRSSTEWSLEDFAHWHHRLGFLFGEAAKELLVELEISPSKIRAVGCHGQTVFHHDGDPAGGTLQAGDPAVVAAVTGIPTVGDFRWSDLAAGGQGAPLSPFSDWILHRHSAPGLGILNLGGISNFTLLKGDSPPRAWDCGPANGPLDALARREGLGDCDTDGTLALSGACIPGLLEALQAHPFFAREIPRSTGLEEFGAPFLARACALHPQASSADLMATLVEVAAWAVADSIQQSASLEGPVYLCGGGARNLALVAALKRNLDPIGVHSYQELGWNPDWREATAFALLADAFLENEPATWPSTTGCSRLARLGRICHPPFP
jgi:anhydro-N-acetylmuramic acid kinase